jgi:predicted lipid-binding transport protein (Tim44 family)
MNGSDSIFTIIFLVLAVIIFLRLRSVLGRRTGNERQPFDPFARRDSQPREPTDKVITLPPRQGREVEPPPAPQASQAELDTRIRGVAAPDSALAAALRSLMGADPAFDPKAFLEGAKIAYEMVVTAFAQGDRRSLRQLLSRDVYDGFVAAIGQREARQESIEFKFIGIQKAEITEAAIRGGTAQVTIRFVSELISATRDKAGAVIDGDPSKVSEVTDIWTFSREVASRDPNWRLVATESVE